MKYSKPSDLRVGIIGLGYVGLPLAVEFAKKRPVIGFDIDPKRIAALKNGNDLTMEISRESLESAKELNFTCDAEELGAVTCFIITVPTPIDEYKRPDLGPILAASATVGRYLKHGDIVVYESTVYPGATEEECVPLLERISGLKFNLDFYCGYSPERINPGDKSRRLTDIVKVTSGSTEIVGRVIDELYREIISAGTFPASSIRVAEASKVIENTQRDVNIALINELAIIFNKLGIDTSEVLEAAGTKWNFAPFRPGLVGGHCIGVDPYYLTHKAQAIGYHPEVILAGRRLNDEMGSYVAGQFIKAMIRKSIPLNNSKVLIMGLTFKENCPDLRNTRVKDVIDELLEYDLTVEAFDPWVDAEEAEEIFGIKVHQDWPHDQFDSIIAAVAHSAFRHDNFRAVMRMLKPNYVLYDLKHIFPKDLANLTL